MSLPAPDGVALAIELSSGAGSIAARRGPRTVERALASQRAHAADLLVQVNSALEELGAGPRDLLALLVGLGPGSYTGLRVAAASAQGLARGTGAALRGVPSIEALARTELRPSERGAVLIDARAKELYVAVYERGPRALETLIAPRVARAEELGSLLAGVDVLLADDGALAAAALDAAAFPRRSTARPTASAVLELGLEHLAQLGAHQPAQIEPLYLRGFAATRRRL